MLGANRPLVLVGARKDAIEDVPRDATWMRPPGHAGQLAVVDGAGARRGPAGAQIAATDGAAAAGDGRRRGVEDRRRQHRRRAPGDPRRSRLGGLPPFFILKVPAFGVAAKVKRVWVAQPGPATCGAAASSNVSAEKTAKMPWPTFVKDGAVGIRRRRLRAGATRRLSSLSRLVGVSPVRLRTPAAASARRSDW